MDATPITTLPDDPILLKQLLMEERTRSEQIKQEAADSIEAMKQKHQAEVEAILRRFYGPKSERFDPAQLLLFGIVIDSMPVDENAVEAESGEKLVTRRIQHKHGRAKLPEALPRVAIEHDLKPEEKKCPCCGLERCRIGMEVTEQPRTHPGEFQSSPAHPLQIRLQALLAGMRRLRRQGAH